MKFKKLNVKKVLQARELFAADDMTIQQLADKFHVNILTMTDLLNGRSWKQITFFAKIVCMYCDDVMGIKGGFVKPADATSSICQCCMAIHHPAKEAVNA